MADATLMRYAGRFVWLDLDFDKPENQAFIVSHGVAYTPTLFVLDPADERATATQLGTLTLSQVQEFLERGERGVRGKAKAPADAALAQGDAMLGRGRMAEAASSYRDAFRLAKPGWPDRDRALSSYTLALMTGKEYQTCAETAIREAPKMRRGAAFATVVRTGLSSANSGGEASWAVTARKTLEPLASEAVSLASATRDDHYDLYMALMESSDNRGDRAARDRWGGRWIDELDARKPANDDERSALDIARVDAARMMDAPARVLPALAASERAMPNNYNASLRLAQMEMTARHYDRAIAACERGLPHVSGPLARSWILQVKAEALLAWGDRAAARRSYEEALEAAKAIGTRSSREGNVKRITSEIGEIDKSAK
jgi:tetratricopeptide (TPR) repeat protein